MKEIINGGVARIVALKQDKWYDPYSIKLLEESGIELTLYEQNEVDADLRS